MPPMTGRVIAGRYNLQHPIGRGAMGVVWRARDTLLDRDVAVKEVVISALIGADERRNAYQRTLREARTAARLSHRGVVTVYDVVEEDARPWIVMELVPSQSLDQVLTVEGRLPPARACRIGQQLLSALAAAHSAGVLHRDVKPSNVLVSANRTGDGWEERAVLTDFGIAQFEGDPRLTQTGMVMGSPGFTAPERIRGGDATPGSDLWSLGATIYAAVEGRGPYEQRGGAITTMSAIINEDAPVAPHAGKLAPLIAALLRREPSTRPSASAAARLFAQVLPQLEGGGGDEEAVAHPPATARPTFQKRPLSALPPSGAGRPRQSAKPDGKSAPEATPKPPTEKPSAERPSAKHPPTAKPPVAKPPVAKPPTGKASGDKPAAQPPTVDKPQAIKASGVAAIAAAPSAKKPAAVASAASGDVEKAAAATSRPGAKPEPAATAAADKPASGAELGQSTVVAPQIAKVPVPPPSGAEPAADAEPDETEAVPATVLDARPAGDTTDEPDADEPEAGKAGQGKTSTDKPGAGKGDQDQPDTDQAGAARSGAGAPAEKASATGYEPTELAIPVARGTGTSAPGSKPAQPKPGQDKSGQPKPVQRKPAEPKPPKPMPTFIAAKPATPTFSAASPARPASPPAGQRPGYRPPGTGRGYSSAAPPFASSGGEYPASGQYGGPPAGQYAGPSRPYPDLARQYSPGAAGGHGGRSGRGPSRARQLAWLGVAVILAAAIGVGAALALNQNNGNQNPASPDSTTTPFKSVNALNDPSTALPAGWTTRSVMAAVANSTAGFSIDVPPGWKETRKGLATNFNGPGNLLLTVDLTPQPSTNMLTAAEKVESASHLGDYKRVDMVAVPVRGTQGAFWKFTWSQAPGSQ